MNNQGSICQQESGQNPNQISTLGPDLEVQRQGVGWGQPGGLHCPLYPLIDLVAWGQGMGMPHPEPQDRLLPDLLTISDQRQGEQARIGMRRLSTRSEFQVSEMHGCTCACVCAQSHAHIWRGGPYPEALSFAGHFRKTQDLFIFSFIAINWLLIGWNVQLSISSNTIK